LPKAVEQWSLFVIQRHLDYLSNGFILTQVGKYLFKLL
jgi:hypothetical protein